jgi:hypothetical protein
MSRAGYADPLFASRQGQRRELQPLRSRRRPHAPRELPDEARGL